MEFSNNNTINLNKETTCNGVLTEKDIEVILENLSPGKNKPTLESYHIRNASENMLGFLADYWKLQLVVKKNGETLKLQFFIKAISRSNAAKADMVKDMRLYDIELFFYSTVKRHLEIPGIKPWSPELTAILNEAMVFQDLNASNYMLRNKFKRFDLPHTYQALKTLARFHSSSFIFEERKSKELQREYRLNSEFTSLSQSNGYEITNSWYKQCMFGALAAIKKFSSKFNEEEITKITSSWTNIWTLALKINDLLNGVRNVICHRDLWNNNIMFHYTNDSFEPDDCVFVDFQGMRYQSPASDVMVLLCCNVDPKSRYESMATFLEYYYKELQSNLRRYDIEIGRIMPWDQFKRSANEQVIWGLVACSCLMPQFWIDDKLTTEIFSNTDKFNEILSEDKASFIINMMEKNEDYKEKVMEIFNELAEKALTYNL